MRHAQALLVLAILTGPVAAPAQEMHPEILVVVNGASEISRRIGDYYAARRGVPSGNVVALDIPLIDPTLTTQRHQTTTREAFRREIHDPIAAHLARHDPQGTIRILVTTKGVPLRIDDPERRTTPFTLRTWASVDAELSLLSNGLDGSPGIASVVNPYFDADLPFATWRAGHPEAPLRYLVARLTGYQGDLDPETGVPRDVKRLIDAALADDDGGLYVIDEDPLQKRKRQQGNLVMLAPAVAALRALGRPVHHDAAPEMAKNLSGIAGYASWGSNDRRSAVAPFYGRIGEDVVPGRFAARSVAVDLVSTNARSFSDPTRYGQSLVADLIRAGVAGVAGHVYEPTLAGVPRPYLLLANHARGVPAVEAYYRSLPYLGWTNVWIGDPLMRVANPAGPPADRDGDGVPDARDNCLWMPNPDQRDSNDDGFGNPCDPDLDGDGLVTSSQGRDPRADLDRLERSTRTGLYVPDHDLDGDGEVDARDVGIAQLYLGLPPGPSGRAGPVGSGSPGPGPGPSRPPPAAPMSP